MRNLLYLFLVTVITITGCKGVGEEDSAAGTIEEAVPYETASLERVDEMFVPESGRVVFRTNNEKYRNLEGITLWTLRGEGEEEYTSRTVVMGKPVGYSGGGYGIVLCHGEREVEGRTEPVMLVVMINNAGQYIVGKAIGGLFKDYGWWRTSGSLRRGSGVSNELTVRYEEGTGEYEIEINGQAVESFRDTEEPVVRGGGNGYIVVVTPFDKFPIPGMDVYFEEIK